MRLEPAVRPLREGREQTPRACWEPGVCPQGAPRLPQREGWAGCCPFSPRSTLLPEAQSLRMKAPDLRGPQAQWPSVPRMSARDSGGFPWGLEGAGSKSGCVWGCGALCSGPEPRRPSDRGVHVITSNSVCVSVRVCAYVRASNRRPGQGL